MVKRTFAKRGSMPKMAMPSALIEQRPFQSTLHRSPVQTYVDEQPDLQTQLAIAQRTTPNWSQMTIGGTLSVVQTKLTVGAPGDQYEQEADRMADQVMSMPDSAIQQPVQREANPEEDEVQTKPIAASITPLVQREAMPEEEEVQTKAIVGTVQREEIPEEEEVQTKSLGDIQREEMPEDEEVQTKPALQRSSDGSLQAGSSIESRLNSSKGGGEPLPDDVRSFMEPRFGTNFSQVRVHTDSEALQMNRDLNAQAFTHKEDIYFGAGKAPAKDTLTAHELTHVVQQTGKTQTKALRVSNDYLEVQQKCDSCKQEDSEILQKQQDFPKLSATTIDVLQRAAGADDAALLAVLMNCVIGALAGVAIDQTMQIGSWAWKKFWKKQDVEFRQNWCKTLVSALFGCVFGVVGGAFERMFFAETTETTGKALLVWIARKAKVLGYKQVSGQIGQLIAKAGCADLEADVSSMRTIDLGDHPLPGDANLPA